MGGERHVLCSVLRFKDGTQSVMVLARGTLEECKNVADRIPAIANSTGKRVEEAFLICPPECEYDRATSDSEEE